MKTKGRKIYKKIKGNYKKIVPASFVFIFAGIGLYTLLQSNAAVTTANLWVDTNGGTCTRQASTTSYSDGEACASFNAAWQAANPGDVIGVKSGTYGAQSLIGAKASTTRIVGDAGTVISGSFTGADNLSLEDVDINTGALTGSAVSVGGNNVVFKNVDVDGQFWSVGFNSNFSWIGGSTGKLGVTPGVRNGCAGTHKQPLEVYGVDNISFDGVTFGKVAWTSDAACNHSEYVNVRDAGGHSGLTIRNSTFENDIGTTTACIFISDDANGQTFSNVLIENTYFGDGCGGNGAFSPRPDTITNCTNFTLAYNTFESYPGSWNCTWTNGKWIGNIGAYASSSPCSGTHTKNIWQHNIAGNCGSDIWVNGPAFSTSALGIDSNTGKLNAGSPAINAAETDTASDYCTGTLGSKDHDGATRPQGSACDAGAFEFVSGGGGSSGIRYVSPSGSNTSNNCSNSGTPCATIGYAYTQAVAGDTIRLSSGTYGNETVANRAGMAGSPVTVTPASGATVSFSNIDTNASNIIYKGPNFNVRSFDVGNGGGAGSRIADVTIDGLNIDAQDTLNTDAIWVGNVTNFTVKNSRVGNTMAGTGPSDTAKSLMTCAGNSTCQVNNMVLENNLFYDADTPTGSQAHLECIWAGGVQGFTLRKNTFRDCTYFDVFITVVVANNQPQPKDHIFEDNVFGQTVGASGADAGYTITLHADVQPSNFNFRRNTIEGAIATANGGGAIGPGGWRITGNIIANGVWLSEPEPMGCRAGIVFDYNVMPNSCGNHTTTATYSAIRAGWTSPKPSYGGADDFTLLSSSPAINKGSPADASTTDIGGTIRSNPPDAGAYEFGGSSGKTGDLNSDNNVNIFDLSILLSNYNKPAAQWSTPKCDLNSDNNVNIFDLSILLSNYGK